jgi:hypothetical protein
MERGAIGFRIHRDRLEAELTTGSHHSDCDFAAIGDENFLKTSRHSGDFDA